MGRGTLIAVLGAVVVGGAAGGLAALWLPSDAPTTAAATAQAGSSAAAPPAAAPPAALPTRLDPSAVLTAQMKLVLARFAEWSRDHAGAPCPDAAALGVVALDPWGHDLELTCTDQPADQMIGATSAGPDGVAGSGDDLTSWTLGPQVTELVHGARWRSMATGMAAHPGTKPAKHRKDRAATRDHAAATLPTAPATPRAAPAATAPAMPATGPTDAGGDDIPSRR